MGRFDGFLCAARTGTARSAAERSLRARTAAGPAERAPPASAAHTDRPGRPEPRPRTPPGCLTDSPPGQLRARPRFAAPPGPGPAPFRLPCQLPSPARPPAKATRGDREGAGATAPERARHRHPPHLGAGIWLRAGSVGCLVRESAGFRGGRHVGRGGRTGGGERGGGGKAVLRPAAPHAAGVRPLRRKDARGVLRRCGIRSRSASASLTHSEPLKL